MVVAYGEMRSRLASLRLPKAATSAWMIIALGAIAHLGWYLERGSLWLDEATLALNIVHRSPAELLEELSFHQGAPWGFLLAEKFAVATFGVGDRSLRLVPLLAALASLPVFLRVASFYLRGPGLLLALLFFCFSPLLVLYSAEVKQYGLDVLATLVALWLAHSARQSLNRRRVAAIGIAGAALLWFSHASMIVLGASGLAVGVAAVWHRDWPAVRRLAVIGSAWSASAGAFFLLAWPKLAQLREGLSGEAFSVPFTPSNSAEARLLVRKVSDILEFPFGAYGRPWSQLIALAGAVLLLAGVFSLTRRDQVGAAVLVAPLIATAAAMAGGLYPYAARFVLFLVPLIVVLVAAGAAASLGALARPGSGRRLLPAAAVIAAVFLLSTEGAYTARLLVTQRNPADIRPVLESVRSAWQPGDVLYLHAGSQYAARYYAEAYDVNRSIAGEILWPIVPTSGTSATAPALQSVPPALIVGRIRREGGTTFMRDVVALEAHKRVWFVFAHVVRFEGGEIVDDLEQHIAVLNAAGQRQATIEHGRAMALLYDLRS